MLLELDLGRLEEATWPAGARRPLTQMGGREVCGLVGGFHGVPGPDQTPNSCTRIRLYGYHGPIPEGSSHGSAAGAGAEARFGLEWVLHGCSMVLCMG
jgi:hypothetical protein